MVTEETGGRSIPGPSPLRTLCAGRWRLAQGPGGHGGKEAPRGREGAECQAAATGHSSRVGAGWDPSVERLHPWHQRSGPEPSSESWRALVLPQPLLLSLYGLGVGLGAREDTGSHCSDRPRGPGRLCLADPNACTCGSVLGTWGHTCLGTRVPAGPMERRHTAQLWLIVSTDFKEN